MTNVAPWSFSKIKSFQQCPKQFYYEKILKQYPTKVSQAMLYGTHFHTACENYIGKGEPLPEKYSYMQGALDSLNAIEGTKIAEQRLGLTEDMQPCKFGAKDVWFRGIVDLAIVNEEKETAFIVDYKTGKNAKYADKGQLELMAVSIFQHYPQVRTIKAALMFVVPKALIKAEYTVEQVPDLWVKWRGAYASMQAAADTDVWNPRPSGLCRQHCPVLECAHNGKN